MRLPVSLEDAWSALVALPATRGELLGYTGTAVLEEADDDVHVAVFRLHGAAGTAAATARLTTALAPAPDGTSIAFELDLHAGPGAEIGHDELLAALYERAPAALAAGTEAAQEAARATAAAGLAAAAGDAPGDAGLPAPSPVAVTAGASPAPAWSETVEWVEPATPAPPPRDPAPASRSTKVALVAGAAAAALLAARALRKGS